MTTIFNHDLLTISTKDKASVISYINKFMRNAKQYIIDNNLDFKIANDILAE
jgi:Tfp pilus assembly protein PilZ